MIDLSTLKIGDSVKFRNGGVSVVNNISFLDVEWPYYVSFGTFNEIFKADGSVNPLGKEDDFDIIEIIKKPEEVEKFLAREDVGYKFSDNEKEKLRAFAQAILKQAAEEMK